MSSSSRDHMKVFKFLQVRRYPYLPADFFNRLRDWFATNSFEIAMFNQNSVGLYTNRGGMGDGSMRGRRNGIHLNFVPKFTFDVQADPSGYLLTFCYYARIRKIGIASAIITQGLTAVIGAATLAGHVATERSFVESVWRVVDSLAQGPYQIVLLEGPESIDNYRAPAVTTTTIITPPTVIPVQQPISRGSLFSQFRSSSSSVRTTNTPYENMVPRYPPVSSQPPPPPITNSYYGSGNSGGMSANASNTIGSLYSSNSQMGSRASSTGFSGTGSTANKSQSFYGSNAQMGSGASSTGFSGANTSNIAGSTANKSQSFYSSNAQMGSGASSTGFSGANTNSMSGSQQPFNSNASNTVGSLYSSNSQMGSNTSSTGFSGTGSTEIKSQSFYGPNAQMGSGVSPQTRGNPSWNAPFSASGNPPSPHPYAYGANQMQSQGITQSQIQGQQAQTATLYPPPIDSTRISGSSSSLSSAQQQQMGSQSNPFSGAHQNPFSGQSSSSAQGYSTPSLNSQGIRLDKDASQNQTPTVSLAKGGLGYSYTYQNLT